jgi:hypothetical protein
MKLFNYFLILSGLLLGAFPALRSLAPDSKLPALLPALLVLTAFTFWRLEERTRQLVRIGEDALRHLDSSWSSKQPGDGPHPLQLFDVDEARMAPSPLRHRVLRCIPVSYSHSFRIVFAMNGGVGAILSAWLLLF